MDSCIVNGFQCNLRWMLSCHSCWPLTPLSSFPGRPIPPTSSSSLLPSAQLPSSHNPPPVSCQMPLLDSNTSHQIMDTNPDEEFSPNSYLLRACSGPQQASSSGKETVCCLRGRCGMWSWPGLWSPGSNDNTKVEEGRMWLSIDHHNVGTLVKCFSYWRDLTETWKMVCASFTGALCPLQTWEHAGFRMCKRDHWIGEFLLLRFWFLQSALVTILRLICEHLWSFVIDGWLGIYFLRVEMI